MMVVVTKLIFLAAFALALRSLWNDIVPNRARIWRLLADGPMGDGQSMPAIRFTARRGVVRQRPATVRPALRAAA